MADFLGGLLSGGGGLYDDLLTPQQQSQLSSRGLLSMAGAFADAAMPSRFPVPLGAAIGKAAAAMSGGRDEAALKLLQGQKLSQEVQTMKARAALEQMLMNEVKTMTLPELLQRWRGASGGAPAAAGPAVTPGPAAAAALTGPLPGGDASFGPDLSAATAAAAAAAAGSPALPSIIPPRRDLSGYGFTPSAGLLGGPDPSQAAAVEPPSPGAPDTVLPSGPGGLLATPASYNGGGAAAGDQWLNANAPFPTQQRPDTPPIQWTNDQPKVPFGQDPGDVLPGGGPARPATNVDTVIPPPGRPALANMLRQVADKGGVPGAPGAPAAAGGNPEGMNTLLLELAKRNAMAEILKLGNPYGSMLSVLQGTPEYKGQIAGAEAKATQPFTQENATHASHLKILEDMAKDNMTVDKNGNIVLLPEAQRIRTMNAEQQAEAKAKWETPQEVPVYSPDGTTKIEKMSPFEFRRREADKARRAALGDIMPRPGDLAQTPYFKPGEAEQQTAAMAPQHLGPTDAVIYPPGSVGASNYQSDKMRGKALPDNVTIQPDGSVRVTGGTQTTGQIDQTQKDFYTLKDEATAAREGLYKAQLLREQLHQIGTSGPLTASLGSLGALAQQLGVPESTVVKYTGARPANVEAAEKLSQDLLGEVLKATFPQRITNADITAWKNTVPRGTMLQEAYDLLLDKTIMPKFERTISRYGSVASLPAADPQLRTYTQKLEEFDKANPHEKFVGTYIYGQGALAGHRLRLIDNQWVDTATGKPVQ